MARDEITQEAAERLLRKIIRAASARRALVAAVGTAKWTVDLKIMGEGGMKKLNKSYRGKDKPTDVLSFPAPELFHVQGQLGSLAVCRPVALRQAREFGHPARIELAVLLVHGLLHLLNFDHERGEKDAKLMARWEKALLKDVLSPSWRDRAAGLVKRN